MFSLPDFSHKARQFSFTEKNNIVDLGRSSAYWTLEDNRKCISEHSIDRTGNIYETYYFSAENIATFSVNALFDLVKSGHLHYEHHEDINVTATLVKDKTGHQCWALKVHIAQKEQLFRKRPPVFYFYNTPPPPLTCWSIFQKYRKAQASDISFIVIACETGSVYWGDNEFYSFEDIKSAAELESFLESQPSRCPPTDYTDFNYAVIDARDKQQPFNESVYYLTDDWLGRQALMSKTK